MKNAANPSGNAARHLKACTDKDTAPAPNFHQLLAQQLHICWLYRLHSGDDCRVVFPDGAARDEVIDVLERKFPGRPLTYLKPVLGGRRD
ncbi:MAG: hypothetical protein RIE06_27530 [Roseibium album]|uniref:hypothetical protein n=1 Tax=Roseibium album TaxID=311410 RepID=UPI0032EBA330